jgi:MYXO-CTERM domain-containing protein
MDAVPDNGDDPNDVPLDGGVLLLGLAGFAFGIRKKK